MTHGIKVILMTSALVLGACATSARPRVPMNFQDQCAAANRHEQLAAVYEREAHGMWTEAGVLEDQRNELLRRADKQREIARRHERTADRLASKSVASGGAPRCVIEQPSTS